MDTVYQQIQDALTKHTTLGIVVGKNPTMDEMGAALSLYLALKASGKAVSIASPSDPLVEVSSLVGIDKVKKSVEAEGSDLVVSFPYQEGEIEKISYTLEGGFLNIIVKAGEKGLNFQQSDVEFKRGGGAVGLLFVIGTPRLSDLESLFDAEKLKDTTIVNIDNKADNQGYGDILMVSPRMSSVSEMAAEIISHLQLPLDQDIAQNLMSGISYATNNFQNPKTSAAAFAMAGMLLQKGAVRGAGNVAMSGLDDLSFDDRSPMPAENYFPPVQNRPAPRPMPRPQMRPQGMPRPQRFPSQQSAARPQPNMNQPMPSMPQTPPAPRPQPQAAQNSNDAQKQNAPSDWLTPKIYKGSTQV